MMNNFLCAADIPEFCGKDLYREASKVLSDSLIHWFTLLRLRVVGQFSVVPVYVDRDVANSYFVLIHTKLYAEQ